MDANSAGGRLIGTWRLVSAVREEIPSGTRTAMFGADPQGFLTYAPEGRMIALITRGDRKPPANGRATPAEAEALFRSMLSYAGAWSVAGNEVTHPSTSRGTRASPAANRSAPSRSTARPCRCPRRNRAIRSTASSACA